MLHKFTVQVGLRVKTTTNLNLHPCPDSETHFDSVVDLI